MQPQIHHATGIACYVLMQMYNSFRQTMEQYFNPSANLPNVETVVTEHTPALRSFKVIAEFPLMRAQSSGAGMLALGADWLVQCMPNSAVIPECACRLSLPAPPELQAHALISSLCTSFACQHHVSRAQ